jgi:hypothetical protein
MKNYTVYPSIFILLLGGTFLLGRKQNHDIENERFNPQSEPYGPATSFTGVEMHSQDSNMKYSQSVDELMYSKLFTKPLERCADDIPLSKNGKLKASVPVRKKVDSAEEGL